MKSLKSLIIGGITFHIKGPDFTQLRYMDSVYKEFISKKDNHSNHDVTITLELSDPPPIKEETRIFDNKINWSMYQSEGEYIIFWKREEDTSPTWVARFNEDFRSIVVHCGERLLEKKEKIIFITIPFQFPLDQLMVMFVLNRMGGALIHSAGMGIKGMGMLFAGVSGAGKTTITRLFMENPGVDVLSDDRIIIRKEKNQYRMYGTPWPGDARIARNASLPFKALFFLNQSPKNRLLKLSPSEAVKKILPVTSIQWYEKSMMTRTLQFLEEMVKTIPSYQLDFTPEQGAVDLVREKLETL